MCSIYSEEINESSEKQRISRKTKGIRANKRPKARRAHAPNSLVGALLPFVFPATTPSSPRSCLSPLPHPTPCLLASTPPPYRTGRTTNSVLAEFGSKVRWMCRSAAGECTHMRAGAAPARQTGDMDRDGRRELHYRALEGDVAGIRDRLAIGDDIGLADKQGFTPLHFAAQQSHTEAVRTLLEAGAPVDARDRFGNTPLWRAVFNSRGNSEPVQLLLHAGADPDSVNDAGVTPRELATRMEAEDVLTLFGAH
jgi:hypothetical protein